MVAVFSKIGFTVYNLNISDLIKTPEIINKCRGLIYVGGFTHGDVLGAAHGWYLTLKHNKTISIELNNFMNREDTF